MKKPEIKSMNVQICKRYNQSNVWHSQWYLFDFVTLDCITRKVKMQLLMDPDREEIIEAYWTNRSGIRTYIKISPL